MSRPQNIFYTPYYETILKDDFSVLEEFKEYRLKPNQTVVKPYSSMVTDMNPLRLLTLPKLHGVEKTLRVHFKNFIKMLGVHDHTDFIITTSWMVAIREGGNIFPHKHLNSWFSGLLYFGDDYTNATHLQLENPSSGQSSIWVDMNTEYQPDQMHHIVPRPNLLVFFPSYLRHFSRIHEEEKTRYTLAFNMFPTGELGEAGIDSHMNTSWLSS